MKHAVRWTSWALVTVMIGLALSVQYARMFQVAVTGKQSESYVVDLRYVETETLIPLNSTMGAAKLDQPYTVLVFLSAADCASCLSSTVDWNALSAVVPVKGIVVDSSELEGRRFVRDFQPTFPVFVDQGQLRTAIGLKETPLTVLVDHRQMPVLAAGPTADSTLFVKQVSEVLSRK